jgi:hypothetical protein
MLLVFLQFWGVMSASPAVPVIYCDAMESRCCCSYCYWRPWNACCGKNICCCCSPILLLAFLLLLVFLRFPSILTLLLYLLCWWCTCCYQVPAVVKVSAVAGKPAVALVPSLAAALENQTFKTVKVYRTTTTGLVFFHAIGPGGYKAMSSIFADQ